MGFDEPCFARRRRGARAHRLRPRRADSTRCARAAGSSCRCPTRRSPTAASRRASGKCLIDAPGLGVPDHVPNYESAERTPALAQRYPLAMISPPARNFLNSTFVNVHEPARHRGRAAARDPCRRRRRRAASPTARPCASSTTAAATCAPRAVSERARPGVVNGLGIWWRKLGMDGTNVNELTHQQLTDIGRAPTFYDCLVEVRPEGASAVRAA